MIKRLIQFIKTDIWKIRLKDLPKKQAIGLKGLRIIILASQDFVKDNCQLRASGLTYYTLLTIVPVLALAFGVAQGFGLEKLLEDQMYKSLQGQEKALDQIFLFVRALLEKTKGGLIAGIGVVVLLWSVIRILSNIEATMNKIWEVRKARSFVRKVTDYIALMFILPLFALLSSSTTIYLGRTVKQLAEGSEVVQGILPLINTPLRLLPYIIIWLLLSLLYIIIPNQKVQIKAGLIGGILAGTAYQLVQWGYVNFQVGVSNYNAIYGSFAALPLFLIWLQLSWMIVLFGAEVAYAVQNSHEYEQYNDIKNLSPYYERILALYATHLIIKQFDEEKPPLTTDEISQKMDVQQSLVQRLLNRLETARVIVCVEDDRPKRDAYQPARAIDKLSIQTVVQLLDKNGVNDLNIDKAPALENLKSLAEKFEKIVLKSPENQLLKNL